MVLISLSMFSYLLPSITKSLQRKMISGLAKGLFDTRGHVLFEKKPSLFYYTNRKDLVTLLYKEFLFLCFHTSSTVKCNKSYIKGLKTFCCKKNERKAKENIDYFFLEEGKQTCH